MTETLRPILGGHESFPPWILLSAVGTDGLAQRALRRPREQPHIFPEMARALSGRVTRLQLLPLLKRPAYLPKEALAVIAI